VAKIFQWSEVEYQFTGGSLLLGNGASRAVSEEFSYDSLFEEARARDFLTEAVQEVFNSFGVNDFELILRRLWQAKLVNEALDLHCGELEDAYVNVREALIQTVRSIHVSYEEAEPHLINIYRFSKKFKTILSLNYDLILYWAAQLGNRTLGNWFKDCFWYGTFKNDWDGLKGPYKAAGSTLYFYPHGNLVLKRVGFSGEEKIQSTDNENLLEAILTAWVESDLSPAFICEGTKQSKLESISSCNYFERVYFEVLPNIEDTLVIYGWAFGDQDDHIIERLEKSNVRKVAVSIYGKDLTLCGKVERKLMKLNLESLVFFDANSAGCWNNPSEEFERQEEQAAQAMQDALDRVLNPRRSN
jgi:hypothetical protein